MDRKNPFLILGLPANATNAQIRANGQHALARARLSEPNDPTKARTIEGALEILRDPVQRLRCGLEWPALGDTGAKLLASHPELLALTEDSTGDTTRAVESLVSGESESSQAHIRAVFQLMRAHELYSNRNQRSARDPRAAPSQSLKIASSLLSSGVSQWNLATSSREFWIIQRMRAKEFDDPRLSVEHVKELEETSTKLVLKRFATLASDALRLRDAEACKSITSGLLTDGAHRSQVESVLMDVYGPLCRKTTTAIEQLTSKLNALKSKSEAPYAALLRDYVAEVEPDVGLMLAVGDLPGSSEELARDGAADFLRALAVKSANEADGYQTSRRALEYARHTANTQSLLEKIKVDRGCVEDLLQKEARNAKTAPLEKQLHAAIARADFESALRTVDQLIALESGTAVTQLQQLRAHLSTHWATKLFNEAVVYANDGHSDLARATMEHALKVETNPAERLVIQHALRNLRAATTTARTGGPWEAERRLSELRATDAAAANKSKAGCLIPLVVGMTVALSLGLTASFPNFAAFLLAIGASR